MVETKRRSGEKFESFLRRNARRIAGGGFLQSFKDRRFFTSAINRNRKKKQALFGLRLKRDREYLQKIGKYEEVSR